VHFGFSLEEGLIRARERVRDEVDGAEGRSVWLRDTGKVRFVAHEETRIL
jgi:hypothetical protein